MWWNAALVVEHTDPFKALVCFKGGRWKRLVPLAVGSDHSLQAASRKYYLRSGISFSPHYNV